MKFISIKKHTTAKAKKAHKKAVKSNPQKKGSIMVHKKKKKAHKKTKSNPVKVKKVYHKKRHNPFKKSYHKKRHNPIRIPKMGGIANAAKEIIFATIGLIVVMKVMAKTPISANIKNFAKIGIGVVIMLTMKNPIAKAIGLTVAVIGSKDALAEKWPDTFAGEDEYLIAGEDDFVDGDELLGTNNLVGAELMGTNNLLRGDYRTSYGASNDSGMEY